MNTCIKCPITALKVSGDILLSGHGSKLIVHKLSDNSKILSSKIFFSSRIHKFVECNHVPGVWLILGGKTVRCIKLQHNGGTYDVVFLCEEKVFKDWLWDAYWVTSKLVLFISAHNTVLSWDPFTDTTSVVSSCKQQCILYSATFSLFQNELVVAVGTVFNKVLLWKPNYNVNNKHEYQEVYKTFVGHEGVIFGLRFYESGHQMLSVSDDRSIRLWSLIDGTCLHVLYGHVARVWDAQYTKENIISIGEDAVCIVWNSSGNIVKKYAGHKGKSIWSLDVSDDVIVTGGGDGAIRMWNMKEEQLEMEGSPLELELPMNDLLLEKDIKDYPRIVKFINHNNMIVFSNNGVLWTYILSSASWTVLHQDERFYSYCCLDISSNFVAIGNLKGVVKIININNISCICEKQLFSGKVLSVFWLPVGTQYLLLACGPAGEIKVLSVHMHKTEISLCEMCQFNCPQSKQRWIAAVDIIVSNYEKSSVIDDISNIIQHIVFICGDRRGSIHVFLPNSKDPVQSVLGVHGKTGITQIKVHNGYIYSTGRDGTFRKYHYESKEQNLSLIDKQKACKGMDWIEGIWFSNSDIIVYGFYMQNHFATWNFESNELQFKIQCGGGYRSWDIVFPNTDDKNTLCFTYVKGAVLNLLSYSCKESNHGRIIQESLHGREIMAVKVLGKHVLKDTILWLLATCSEDTCINFLIYDDVKMTVKSLHSAVGHIGGVRDICFVPLKTIDQSNDEISGYVFEGFFFSSGSRTSLKLWMLRDNIFTCINDQLNIAVNAESLVSHDFSCSLMCEIYTPEIKLKKLKLKDHNMIDDMRYLSCDAFLLKHLYPTISDIGNILCCVCGCSDGTVRVYIFNDSSIDLLTLLDCDKHCVLTVRTCTYVLNNSLKTFLFCTATNGLVYIWDITSILEKHMNRLLCNGKVGYEETTGKFMQSITDLGGSSKLHNKIGSDIELETDSKTKTVHGKNTCEHINQRMYSFHSLKVPLWFHDGTCVKVPAHQSGVNTIDILKIYNGFLLVSGGDDSCICITKLLFNNNSLEIVCTSSLESSHISSISAVLFVNETLVVSTSVDQRIKFWSIKDVDPSLVHEIITDIADVSNMEVWVSSGVVNVAVTGVGLEIFAVPMGELHNSSS